MSLMGYNLVSYLDVPQNTSGLETCVAKNPFNKKVLNEKVVFPLVVLFLFLYFQCSIERSVRFKNMFARIQPPTEIV